MTSREDFEKSYPTPIGVRWIDGIYSCSFPSNSRSQAATAVYIARWQAWQAATARAAKIATELNCPQVAGAIGGGK